MKIRKSAVALWVLILLGMVIVSGCGPGIAVETPAPTPDIVATVEAAVTIAMATQAAQAEPTATPTSVPPTATPEPTDTPTVGPTDTSIPTDTPTAPPTLTDTPAPTPTPSSLTLPPSIAPLVVKSETVALITDTDQFVIVDAGVLRANADPVNRNEKEKFTLLHLNNGKVAFRTSDGRFVTATLDEPWLLIAEETQDLHEEQQFTLIDLGNGEVAIKTFYNRYITAMKNQDGWNWELRAEKEERLGVDFWERFELASLAE